MNERPTRNASRALIALTVMAALIASYSPAGATPSLPDLVVPAGKVVLVTQPILANSLDVEGILVKTTPGAFTVTATTITVGGHGVVWAPSGTPGTTAFGATATGGNGTNGSDLQLNAGTVTLAAGSILMAGSGGGGGYAYGSHTIHGGAGGSGGNVLIQSATPNIASGAVVVGGAGGSGGRAEAVARNNITSPNVTGGNGGASGTTLLNGVAKTFAYQPIPAPQSTQSPTILQVVSQCKSNPIFEWDLPLVLDGHLSQWTSAMSDSYSGNYALPTYVTTLCALVVGEASSFLQAAITDGGVATPGGPGTPGTVGFNCEQQGAPGTTNVGDGGAGGDSCADAQGGDGGAGGDGESHNLSCGDGGPGGAGSPAGGGTAKGGDGGTGLHNGGPGGRASARGIGGAGGNGGHGGTMHWVPAGCKGGDGGKGGDGTGGWATGGKGGDGACHGGNGGAANALGGGGHGGAGGGGEPAGIAGPGGVGLNGPAADGPTGTGLGVAC